MEAVAWVVVGPVMIRWNNPLRKCVRRIRDVGIDNPEGRITVVDARHRVRSLVDLNRSLVIGASQLVGCKAAFRWVTSPAERGRHVAKTAAGEREAVLPMMLMPPTCIWDDNCKHKQYRDDSQGG